MLRCSLFGRLCVRVCVRDPNKEVIIFLSTGTRQIQFWKALLLYKENSHEHVELCFLCNSSSNWFDLKVQ
jgi:hypothetical protein